MDLLEFARGPALTWSIIIFVIGVVWRLTGTLLLPRKRDYSEPRSTATFVGGLKTIITRSLPAHEFHKRIAFSHTMGYTFHIGLFIVIFLFVPHIMFFKDIVGVSWPGLPNGVIYFAGVVTIIAMVALMVRRFTHPVLKLISNFDDYLSWFVTVFPVITGLMATAHLWFRYETLLAVHILSVELLLVWFPFGKLMHTFNTFIARWTQGSLFTRKGAAT